ncbi:lysoplasmalogenase family protein [Nioella nitratireducens]|uniref:lysoplasmalogenase family protein n=1 Tax=Nioella nitratireducens TaxID=1287720 RepID=UPI0008FCEDB4|nr:lysoplasmalogenase family protein [Nioella nitratireducens]
MTAAMIAAGLGACVAVVYQGFVPAPVGALRSGLKTVPVALFALAALLTGAPWLALGLALGALGDFALSRAGERAFLIGLVSFAAAHLVYAWLFAAVPDALSPTALNAPRWLGVGALVAMALSTPIWLLPFTGALSRAVAAYVVIITAMGIAALHLPAAQGVAIFGAGLFVASDLVLAVGLFRLADGSRQARIAAHLVWPLYWLGQAGILMGMVWVGG